MNGATISATGSTPTRRKRTRSLACMHLDKVVGSGTFGVVYRAIDKSTPEQTVVALKKIKMQQEKQGFPLTAIREIKILNTMNHNNVVRLREVVTYNEGDEEQEESLVGHPDLSYGDVFMVFEFVDFDLAKLLQTQKFRMTPDIIKCYLRQLLEGVRYLHENKILHRDIKSANLLITRGHVLKIADWGLARVLPPNTSRLTVPVVTLWYRSPELILGRNNYGPEIDIWSIGCIFGEMATRLAMFPGDTDPVQIELIFSLLGTPQGPLLELYRTFPQFENIAPKKVLHPRLHSRMSLFVDNDHGLSLLGDLLHLDPVSRPSSSIALQHPYFDSCVEPCNLPPIHLILGSEAEADLKKQEQIHHQQLRHQKNQLLQLQQHPPPPPPSNASNRGAAALGGPSNSTGAGRGAGGGGTRDWNHPRRSSGDFTGTNPAVHDDHHTKRFKSG